MIRTLFSVSILSFALAAPLVAAADSPAVTNASARASSPPAFYPGVHSEGAGEGMRSLVTRDAPDVPGTECEELAPGLCACLLNPESSCNNQDCSSPQSGCSGGIP